MYACPLQNGRSHGTCAVYILICLYVYQNLKRTVYSFSALEIIHVCVGGGGGVNSRRLGGTIRGPHTQHLHPVCVVPCYLPAGWEGLVTIAKKHTQLCFVPRPPVPTHCNSSAYINRLCCFVHVPAQLSLIFLR